MVGDRRLGHPQLPGQLADRAGAAGGGLEDGQAGRIAQGLVAGGPGRGSRRWARPGGRRSAARRAGRRSARPGSPCGPARPGPAPPARPAGRCRSPAWAAGRRSRSPARAGPGRRRSRPRAPWPADPHATASAASRPPACHASSTAAQTSRSTSSQRRPAGRGRRAGGPGGPGSGPGPRASPTPAARSGAAPRPPRPGRPTAARGSVFEEHPAPFGDDEGLGEAGLAVLPESAGCAPPGRGGREAAEPGPGTPPPTPRA